MRILVADYELPNHPGGAENYSVAIIEQLVNLGHHVDSLSINPLGKLAQLINKLGVNTYTHIPKGSEYRLILASHKPTVQYIRQLGIKGFLVQTCHGNNDANEPEDADAFVSVSQEIKNRLQQKNIKSTLILNGINCDKFYPKIPISHKPERILSLCQSKKANKLIEEACQRIDATFRYRNKFFNPTFDIQDEINHADLVVTLGRGAYEAMSCGRSVVIFDQRSYMSDEPIGDGIIKPEYIEQLIKYNCSGRCLNRTFNVEGLINEFKQHDYYLGNFGRSYALKNLNIKTQVNKYLELMP